MIAATATFAVFKRESSPTTIQVVTILTNLADIRPHDAIAPALPTYAEAVRIATERGLARDARIGFLKQFGVAEFVPVCERDRVRFPGRIRCPRGCDGVKKQILTTGDTSWRRSTTSTNKPDKAVNRPACTIRYGAVRRHLAQRGGQRQCQPADVQRDVQPFLQGRSKQLEGKQQHWV